MTGTQLWGGVPVIFYEKQKYLVFLHLPGIFTSAWYFYICLVFLHLPGFLHLPVLLHLPGLFATARLSVSAAPFGTRLFWPVALYHISIISVPATMAARPIAERLFSRSWKTRKENAMVTRILSLSMGTMRLAGPSCRAW